MSILKVCKLGNPVLRQEARPVSLDELRSLDFQRFIDDMVETMREYDGVGLAAPQVHVSQQVAVIESQASARYPDGSPISLFVMINPQATYISEEKQLGWEGCLSVDNLRGQVPRATQIKVKALDRQGQELHLDASGFLAVVLQHELDHLAGHLYLDCMEDFGSLAHMREFYRHWVKDE